MIELLQTSDFEVVYTTFKSSPHEKQVVLGSLGHFGSGLTIEICVLKHAKFRISATFWALLNHCASTPFLSQV